MVVSDNMGVEKVLLGNWAFIKVLLTVGKQILSNLCIAKNVFFIMQEKSFLDFALSRDFQNVKHCRMTLAKETFFTVGFAFAVNKKQRDLLSILDKE